MLGNLASLVVTSFVSLGTLFSPSPKIVSPIPTPEVTIQVTQQRTVTKPSNILLNPTTIPTPTIQPTTPPKPTATPTTLPSPTPTNTPTPTETVPPTPTPTIQVDVEASFTNHANHYSVDKELLKKIARCESGMNSNAENGPYGGLFQFSESSWRSTRGTMGMDPDPTLRFNIDESIRTAAFKLSTGGRSAWPNC